MLFKSIFRCLLIGVAALAVSIPGQAAMVGTAQLHAAGPAVELGVAGEQLVIGGVSEGKAAERVAAMTDAQVREVFQRIDESPAGGADALLVVLIVLIVLEVMGYTDFIKD
jgi:hypothetical protein